MRLKKEQIEGKVSGGKLTEVRNKRFLEGKGSIRSKPKGGGKEGKERPVVDAAGTRVQKGEKNSKVGKAKK